MSVAEMTDDQIKDGIAKLEAKEDELHKQIADIADALTKLRCELALREYGGRPGDRVIHKGKEYEVSSVHEHCPDWRFGREVKKSGEVGVREFCMYEDWKPKT